MNENTTIPDTIEINKSLKKTDFGAFVVKNKNLLVAAFGALVILSFGWAIYYNVQQEKLHSTLKEYYTFFSPVKEKAQNLTKMLADFRDEKAKNKVTSEDLISQSQDLITSIKTLPADFFKLPVALLDTLNFLSLLEEKEIEEGLATLSGFQADLEILGFLEKFLPHFRPKESLALPLMMKLSNLYELSGNVDQAIVQKENLIKAGHKILEAELYLDLGRLYLKSGNREQAKRNFNHVLSNFASSESARAAKIYLLDL